jgi:hypothetical protein
MLFNFNFMKHLAKYSHHYKSFFFLFCLINVSLTEVLGQSCGCNITVKSTQFSLDGKVTPVKPGDVICLEAGTRGRIIIKNIVGTAANPIIIKNCGGPVIVSNDPAATSSTFLVQYSKYFKITGTGDNKTLHGIQVQNGQNGLVLSELCTNFEVEYVEVRNTKFAGVMAKTDPICADSMTWRRNFTMYDISLHHNYIHDITGEGFYVGNSFYASGAPGLSACASRNPDSHKIINARVFKNNVKRSGVEGIQVGCAIEGCKIYDNVIDSLGLNPFEPNQDNGLQLGEGTGGLCYNNWISNVVGNGLICLGIGDNLIYNNVIYKTGESGMFVDDVAAAKFGTGVKLINNTIINPTNNGIRIYTDLLDLSYIYNNIIVKQSVTSADPYIKTLNSNVKLDQKGNYFVSDITKVMFMNPANLDFRIKAGSPAISAGVDVSSMGITTDLNNYTRNLPYDAGAYELGSNNGNPLSFIDYRAPIKVNKSFFVFPNPVYNSNQDLTFEFTLDTPSKVSILSYDINGRLVEENLNKEFNEGLNHWTISSNTQSNTKVNFLVFKLMVNGIVKDSQTVIFK